MVGQKEYPLLRAIITSVLSISDIAMISSYITVMTIKNCMDTPIVMIFDLRVLSEFHL
jgi:hypothetical protein